MQERTAESTQETGAAVLDELAARNASIELRSVSRDGRPIVARARILGTETGRLLLDQPQSGGRGVVFRLGQPLEIRFRLNDVEYAFESDVVDVSRLLRLNARKKVIGVVISRPSHVRRAPQRRNHYRVRLLGDERVVELHDATPDGSAQCPVDARRFRAELVDLSAGGTGLRLSRESAAALQVGERLFVTFALPDEEEEFTFLAEIRQLRPDAKTGEERLGLEICERPLSRVMQRARQRLQRYLVRVQRNRLKRKR